MNLLEKENIFLLEFMVDRVSLDTSGSWDSKVLNAETCVGFSFLQYGPFYVGDDDFLPTKKWVVNGCSGCGNVKNGKSILFSLTPQMVEENRDRFVVSLEVLKRMPGFTPDTVILGRTVVPLMELFEQLLDKVQTGMVPITKTLKETFEVKDNNGTKIGNTGAYVRLSCFGKVIVTKFQMNYEAESVNFSAKEGKCLYKYNRKDNCNNFRTDVCCPGYPCLPCCPAVQAAMNDRNRKRDAGLGGDGNDGGGSKDGDGNKGDGKDGDKGKGGGKGKGGKGKSKGTDGGSRGSKDSKGSKGSKDGKKNKNCPDVPFVGGPSGGSGKRECPPCPPCPPCNPCDPCAPCNPCDPCPPCNPCSPCQPCRPPGCGRPC